MEEALAQQERRRIEAAMRLSEQQVLEEVQAVVAQLPERQKWQTEVIADVIRTVVTISRAEGVLALALVSAEQMAK